MEVMAVTQPSWKGRRVALTGATGFKGSWLALWLAKLGAQVSGYSLAPPTNPSLFELAGVDQSMDHVEGDIRDAQHLRDFIKRTEPDVVFHLAAQALVRSSYDDPVGTYATNVIGTVNVLDSMRGGNVSAAVVVTSDKCYDNREWPWGYRETDPLGGRGPNTSSKACAELVTAAYRDSFFKSGTRIASARAGNVIGGGDWAVDRLVPDMMRAIAAGEAVKIRNPNAVRPWQHVLEPLHGYIRLAEALWDAEKGSSFAAAWNFGPYDSDVKPVSWIVERIQSQWNGVQWLRDGAEQPHEAAYLKLDSSKSRAMLGVTPKLHLATAIDWTVEWYRDYATNANAARDLVLRDIDRYEAQPC